MITVTVPTGAAIRYLSNCEKEITRSLETAIDNTAFDIRKEVIDEMNRVFDRPTPYTTKQIWVTKTRNHNMQASVWFKDPERMDDHYLLPQVEGTERKLKGFERSMWNTKFTPGKGVKLDKHGNISRGTLVQIKSVLGRAELTSGYQANLTVKSAKRNIKQRDYVYLPNGSSKGALPPGIYQRIAQKFQGLNSAKFRRSQSQFGTYQRGKTRGRISQIIRARGLRPILLVGKQHEQVKPLLKFYEVARRVYDKEFNKHFLAELKKRLP
ncbi:MAG: hypothetical protein VR65_06100 [Desulfobulbaceae bacterium BRH_c16a]|nr:MAG: hypothetical protein VR65_06100 [Desulfobulbaceae bacterium BRH_c16a]